MIRRGALVLTAAVLLPAYNCQYTSDDSSPPPPGSGAFQLLLPLDGSTANLTVPQFSWTADPGAQSYRLQIATTTAFNPPLWDQGGIPMPTVFLGATLTHSSTFYWRVYGENGAAQTLAGGSPFQFTTVGTGGATPGNFGLVLPPPMVNGESRTPLFRWDASVAAVDYTLQVATDINFTSIVVDQQNIKINRAPCPLTLAPMTTYYWRVIAVNSVISKTATGAPWWFTTGP